jgi:hypothetical protein
MVNIQALIDDAKCFATIRADVPLNGRSLFDGLVGGFGSGSAVRFSTNLAMLPGDTIDLGYARDTCICHA